MLSRMSAIQFKGISSRVELAILFLFPRWKLLHNKIADNLNNKEDPLHAMSHLWHRWHVARVGEDEQLTGAGHGVISVSRTGLRSYKSHPRLPTNSSLPRDQGGWVRVFYWRPVRRIFVGIMPWKWRSGIKFILDPQTKNGFPWSAMQLNIAAIDKL